MTILRTGLDHATRAGTGPKMWTEVYGLTTPSHVTHVNTCVRLSVMSAAEDGNEGGDYYWAQYVCPLDNEALANLSYIDKKIEFSPQISHASPFTGCY